MNLVLIIINENFKNKLDFWPANSPDLSPIEELWALVQEKIGKYNFESTEELAKKLQLEGLTIDRTHILRIEKGTVILKDFELIIISKLLNMDLNELKNIL